MDDEHDRPALLPVEPVEQVEHLDLVGEVEVRRGLVEQEQRRLLGEREGDPRPLSLAAGELVHAPPAQARRAR